MNQYISLFSGGMGLDIGLQRAGFQCIVANEIDSLAIQTIRRNRPQLPLIEDSVERVTLDSLNRAADFDVSGIDLIAGGPPCQAFSVFGQRRGLSDQRGKMIFEFFRLVREVKPKTFLMENVRGLHSMPLMPKGSDKNASLLSQTADEKPGSLLKALVLLFESIGYRVDCFLVNVVNYGGPQIRERLLCFGSRWDLAPAFPQPEFSNRTSDNLTAFRTLGDVIGPGFVDTDTSCMNFSSRKLKYLAMVPPGGNWRSLPVAVQKESMGKAWHLKGGRSAYWRRLSFDFPCPTVTTMPNHAGTSMCHPTELRALTVGEMAAVQEFPPDWTFVGSAADKCKQIGNAVPPRLGEVAGRVIQQILNAGRSMPFQALTPASSGHVTHIRPHVRTRSYFKDGIAVEGHAGYYEKEYTK